MNKTIEELRNSLDNKEITKEELFQNIKNEIDKNKDLNLFVTVMEKCESKETSNILSGIPYALKDNFSTSGILTTGSSNILKDYVPVFDSTVYKKLKESGAVLIGKTVLDELAMGGSGLTGHTGIVRNPWDKTRIPGGSSAGSAASVALGIVPFSIGSDTGDSVRKPASLCGVVGFKPTYGRISRYGLFPFASSLDHVGIFTRNVKDAAIVTDALKGFDPLDMTTLPDENINYKDSLSTIVKGKKLFYIKEIIESATSIEAKKTIEEFKKLLEKLKSIGITIEEVSINIDLLKALFPTYFIISCAEATSNNSNLTGFIFGPRSNGNTPEEIMKNTRTKGFQEMIKRRFILGSYILERQNQEKLFLNAKRVRNMITSKINELFKTYDGLILPASSTIAPKIDNEKETDKLSSDYLLLENHLVIGNFGGYPSITIPMYMYNDMPVGVNLTCPVKKDLECLQIASKIEELTGLKNLSVGGKNV